MECIRGSPGGCRGHELARLRRPVGVGAQALQKVGGRSDRVGDHHDERVVLGAGSGEDSPGLSDQIVTPGEPTLMKPQHLLIRQHDVRLVTPRVIAAVDHVWRARRPGNVDGYVTDRGIVPGRYGCSGDRQPFVDFHASDLFDPLREALQGDRVQFDWRTFGHADQYQPPWIANAAMSCAKSVLAFLPGSSSRFRSMKWFSSSRSLRSAVSRSSTVF